MYSLVQLMKEESREPSVDSTVLPLQTRFLQEKLLKRAQEPLECTSERIDIDNSKDHVQ